MLAPSAGGRCFFYYIQLQWEYICLSLGIGIHRKGTIVRSGAVAGSKVGAILQVLYKSEIS